MSKKTLWPCPGLHVSLSLTIETVLNYYNLKTSENVKSNKIDNKVL